VTDTSHATHYCVIRSFDAKSSYWQRTLNTLQLRK